MVNLECYNNIIGITQMDCPCNEENRPADYNESKSGLFLTSLTPLNQLTGFDDCSQGNIWEIAQEAIKNATRMFIADTNALLMGNNTLKRQPFRGGIGEIAAKNITNISENYAGLRIRSANIRGGVLVINGVGALFCATGTVTIWVYNSLNELVATEIINTVAGSHTNTPVNIELPLSHNYTQNIEYFIIYKVDPNNAAKENKLNCGCGRFKPVFCCNSPYFIGGNESGGNGWSNWVMVGGHKTDSLIQFGEAATKTNNNFNGLTLDVAIKCKVSEVFCNEALDFECNPLALSMAYAIYYKAAELLANKLLLSVNLNRFTMVNTEMLAEARAEWTGKYNEYVSYLSENANLSTNDCFECKSVIGLTTGGMFS